MILLTPGPVTTRPETRAALAADHAPWDNDFRELVIDVRARLLRAGGGEPDRHQALILQGAGHFITEAALRTFVPAGGTILIPLTGQYAERMARLANEAGRRAVTMPVGANERIDPDAVEAALARLPEATHVGLVHSETATGICHDVAALGRRIGALGRRTIIDAVSAFGALPLDVSAMPEADAVVFTINKCLEAPPGLGVAIVDVARTRAARGHAQSWSFDLSDLHQNGLDHGWGTFRFTPPAPQIAALATALDFYEAEGRPARLARYTETMRVVHRGVRGLGLLPCLPEGLQGPIVVNVHAPADPRWSLQGFVDALKARGFLISNFYNTPMPSFRVGCIGAIRPADMARAIDAMGEALDEIGIRPRKAA